ncbi:MAG: methionyl-tRNA formyltransferase [Planctomycetes bacterium]|nr:methionyl-tRNA formyltransferase [Planctomycetota bacterium]
MNLAFLGSPPFATACFEYLCTTRFRPCVLVTAPDRPKGRGRRIEESPLASCAREHGIPRLVTENASDPEFLAELSGFDLDWAIVVAFGQILRQRFLDLPRQGCLNVHGSLLPRHRGASPINAAIRDGDSESGISIQRIVLQLDAGDVVHERRVPITLATTAGSLARELSGLAGPTLVEALERIESGRAVFIPQDEALVTHCRKLTRADGRIQWTQPADAIERLVRALSPWPGAWSTLSVREQAIEVTLESARPADGDDALPPAMVRTPGGRAIHVGCGGGTRLAIDRLKPTGGKSMTAEEFLRGRPVDAGSQAGDGP